MFPIYQAICEKIKSKLGRDCLAETGTRCQAWRPEVGTQDLHGGENPPKFRGLSSDSCKSTVMYTNTSM